KRDWSSDVCSSDLNDGRNDGGIMDISFENVSYTYQPNTPFAHQALKNLSFTIPKQSFTAIIGHTGSGKSTLLQHLNGLIRPTEGKVTIGPYTLTKGKKE